jgi:hypothetical protein
MLLGLLPRVERAEISALTGFWIDLPGIKAVLACFEFANHVGPPEI